MEQFGEQRRVGAFEPGYRRGVLKVEPLGLGRRPIMPVRLSSSSKSPPSSITRIPGAAGWLREGMEETLTVHKLRVPEQLRRTLSSTNVIESAFSIVETVCRNVKRWRAGDQIERWVGSGLLVAQRQFRKVIGFRQIPQVLSALTDAVAKKSVAKGAAVA